MRPQRPDNEDPHPNGTWLLRHIGGHDGAVLGDGVGLVTASSPSEL
jgi:hypothetical protein